LLTVHAFDVLGDRVRRRILELLAAGEQRSGAVCTVIQDEFGISQPAVSQHLRVLRDSGFATVRPEGTRRLYAVDHELLREVDEWLDHFRRFWTPPLEALADPTDPTDPRTPPASPGGAERVDQEPVEREQD
jgi:DNA-binding transcriptional ArsR family regulator